MGNLLILMEHHIILKTDYLSIKPIVAIDKINSINNLRTHTEQQKQEIEQRVHIEATFPNVSHSREIEDAFNNLINIAAQRAYNTKRLK